jgi:hypothetical protein
MSLAAHRLNLGAKLFVFNAQAGQLRFSLIPPLCVLLSGIGPVVLGVAIAAKRFAVGYVQLQTRMRRFRLNVVCHQGNRRAAPFAASITVTHRRRPLGQSLRVNHLNVTVRFC